MTGGVHSLGDAVQTAFMALTIWFSFLLIAAESEEESGSGNHKPAGDPESVKTCSQFPTSLMRKSVKSPMSAVISRYGFP